MVFEEGMEKERRTKGESSASTERTFCAVEARWEVGKGRWSVLEEHQRIIIVWGDRPGNIQFIREIVLSLRLLYSHIYCVVLRCAGDACRRDRGYKLAPYTL